MKNSHFFRSKDEILVKKRRQLLCMKRRQSDRKKSVHSNFNFLCGRPHGAGPPSPCPHEPDPPPPPPCGRHKWMAPKDLVATSIQNLQTGQNKKEKNNVPSVIFFFWFSAVLGRSKCMTLPKSSLCWRPSSLSFLFLWIFGSVIICHNPSQHHLYWPFSCLPISVCWILLSFLFCVFFGFGKSYVEENHTLKVQDFRMEGLSLLPCFPWSYHYYLW